MEMLEVNGRITRLLWTVALACPAIAPVPLFAQEDTVTVVAGAHYAAGDVQRFLLGSRYRDLWTTPIRVPVLDPDTFAGGLELERLGGGRQTLSLRFIAKNGREYNFRSVDKDQTGGLPPDLQETWTDFIIQDQISSKHPGAAMVVAPLAKSAGVLHVTPTLAVMADDPALGEYREQFAGMLGMIEEHADESEDGPRFGGFERVIGTDRLRERLEESPEDRPDARAYLAARYLDLLIGDWDRHDGNWRWAQVDRSGRRYWLPVPEDRDNAFFYADGVIGTLGGFIRPYVVQFGPDLNELDGLISNSESLDRLILPELPLVVWDSVAHAMQARLTDEAIARAIDAMPEEYEEMSGAEMAANLRSRRDQLPGVAREFYHLIVRQAEVFGTDESDDLEVVRLPDGSVTVTLRDEDGEVYYERTFDAAETEEVRIDLHGGGDEAVVSGGGQRGIRLRILGGGGGDRLEDAAARGSGKTIFYDVDNDTEFVPGPDTEVDRNPYQVPIEVGPTENNPPPPRDWGSEWSWFSPTADWRSEIGPVVGGGPQSTTYGFRRAPFAHREGIEVLYAPERGRFGVEGEVRITTSDGGETRIGAMATELSLSRFHGFGNETPRGEDTDLRRVWATEFSASAEIVRPSGRYMEFSFGPAVAHFDPEVPAGSPAELQAPPGSASFGIAGLRGRIAYDTRDDETYPRHGIYLEGSADGYPIIWGDAPEEFLRTGLTGSTYLPVPLPLETTLALRAGGQRVWGDAPFQFGASVGGGDTLRGYRRHRFIGDGAVFGSAELRTKIGHADLKVARGDIGTIVLGDVGRVFLSGEDSDELHTGWGGGLWFGPLDREYTVRVLYTQGERRSLSLGLGMPF